MGTPMHPSRGNVPLTWVTLAWGVVPTLWLWGVTALGTFITLMLCSMTAKVRLRAIHNFDAVLNDSKVRLPGAHSLLFCCANSLALGCDCLGHIHYLMLCSMTAKVWLPGAHPLFWCCAQWQQRWDWEHGLAPGGEIRMHGLEYRMHK